MSGTASPESQKGKFLNTEMPFILKAGVSLWSKCHLVTLHSSKNYIIPFFNYVKNYSPPTFLHPFQPFAFPIPFSQSSFFFHIFPFFQFLFPLFSPKSKRRHSLPLSEREVFPTRVKGTAHIRIKRQ